MSLNSYLDPMIAFELWIKANPSGGVFVWLGRHFEVKCKTRVRGTFIKTTCVRVTN